MLRHSTEQKSRRDREYKDKVVGWMFVTQVARPSQKRRQPKDKSVGQVQLQLLRREHRRLVKVEVQLTRDM